MSGASGSEHCEAFHVYLHRNLPLYLYNCILVAGFDKPHVFTSLVEPAAINKMEDYVRNCVVPALTSREERQRYVGLFADKPQLFQISPGHRIQLLMLVKECRTNKGISSPGNDFGIPISPNTTSHASDLGSESFRRRLSDNDSSLSIPQAKHSTPTFSAGGISTTSFAGFKRKLNEPAVSGSSTGLRTAQGLHLNACPSPQSGVQPAQALMQQSPVMVEQPTQQSPAIRTVACVSDDASNSTGISTESEHMSRGIFQPGNNTTQYASPISVEEHERRILRLLERWVRAQPDPVIQNLRRNVDFHLTVTRQPETDVVTAKVVCLRCKKSVALVGRGDTWVLSNYHRHLRSCLSNERHLTYMASSVLGREDLMHPISLSQKSPESYVVKGDGFDVSSVREEGVADESGTSASPQRANLASGQLVLSRTVCAHAQKYDQYPMKSESMASDVSLVDDSESENGAVSAGATPRDQDVAEETPTN